MDNIFFYAFMILLGAFIGSVSQVLLKVSSKKNYDNKIKEYLNPLVIIAYFMFALTTLFSVLAYKVVPLSYGPVLESTSYVYVVLFGKFIFKENVSAKKIIAIIMILLGIAIFSFF